VGGALVDLVADEADLLRVPVTELVGTLRLLTFAASHHQVADVAGLTPEKIVDTVLYGLLADPAPKGTA